jgi:hypothetical protein
MVASYTPNVGAPEWDAAQATPWLTTNKALRIFDAFSAYSIIEDRDLTAPPGACADGARYLLPAAGVLGGAWLSHNGQLAIAMGANASNGWLFAVVALEGVFLFVRDENLQIRHDGAAWQPKPDDVAFLNDLVDVDTTGLADGFVLKWDASNGIWYPAPDIDTTGITGAQRMSELLDVDLTGLVDGLVLKWDASNGHWYAAQDMNDGAGGGGGSSVLRLDDLLDVDLSGLADGYTIKWDASNGFWYPAPDLNTGTGGGPSSSLWQLRWGPLQNEAPSTNFATLDSRNGHPCLDFDTTTQEAAIFSGVLPTDYSGAGITVVVFCSLTSATSGTVGWDVAIERMDASSLDIDADSFASAQTITAVTVPGTSGQLLKMTVNISNGANMDSLAAGELFRIRIRRDVANDTAAGDAELLFVDMVSQ